MVKYRLSIEESELLDAIEDIAYGELIDVEIADGPHTIERQVGRSFECLIEAIRNGNQAIESIKIHQGKPTQVQIVGARGKLKYKKKIIFDR